MSTKPVASTDEERLALAAKLDKELDNFINGLEKKKYTDGWPEDRWQEEMDKHPFFMKKMPEPGEELHPLLEGMQQLKFDPDENTAMDLATNYKEDGKFYMTHKKYRMAVMSYTEALKFKIESDEFNAVLHNNRSAANFFLKNYRSSLMDAQQALKLKPDYEKARWRAAQCAGYLGRFDLCVEICDELLKNDPGHAGALEMRKNIVAKKAAKARDERKLAQLERKREEQIERTLAELRKRGIKFENTKALTDAKHLKPKLAPLEEHMVSVDANGVLHWPIVFCYPEYMSTDFQQQLSEELTMNDCLALLFEEPLTHDTERKYIPENVTVFYENRILALVYKVDKNKSIKNIIAEKTFLIYDGTPAFFVLPTDSEIMKEFLNYTRIPIRFE